MSETITGVIVGGLVASVGPFIQLIYNHRQTRRQERLSFLKEERKAKEERFKHFLKLFEESLDTETISAELSSEIKYHMPEKVFEMFVDYIDNRTEEKKNRILYDVSHELNERLAIIDSQIRAIYGVSLDA